MITAERIEELKKKKEKALQNCIDFQQSRPKRSFDQYYRLQIIDEIEAFNLALGKLQDDKRKQELEAENAEMLQLLRFCY